MATLIGALLLLALSHYLYRARRRALAPDRGRRRTPHLNADVGDGRSLPAELAGQGAGADEARESELCHELLDGVIDPPTYQRLMGEHANTDRR